MFSDHENFVPSRGIGMDDFKLEKPCRPPLIILEVDAPDHTKTRKVMAKALSPKVVRTLMDSFTSAAKQLLEKSEFEGVADLAEAFPTTVFPKVVGMKDVNERHLVDYGAMVYEAANAADIT